MADGREFVALERFDFSLLDTPEFKEDAVREEIVVPLLQGLGYAASGPSKIVRSKALTHPYVLLGTRKHGIRIIPDYTLHADEHHRWILDAKSPSETIIFGSNVEQAFSYAIHPEIRAKRYALCNGRILSVFDINRTEPVGVFQCSEFGRKWYEITRLLSPSAILRPEVANFKQDFGIYVRNLGMTGVFEFARIGIPDIVKIKSGHFTSLVNVCYNETWLALSLDYDQSCLRQLFRQISVSLQTKIKKSFREQPFKFDFGSPIPELYVLARLTKNIQRNRDEEYSPLIVERFSSSLRQSK
jgi:hypothetical protein